MIGARLGTPVAGHTADMRGWEERGLEELERVFSDREQAVLLLVEASFPRERIPEFTTSQLFWARVAEATRNGVVHDGMRRFLALAAKKFPYNPVFRSSLEDAERSPWPVRRSEIIALPPSQEQIPTARYVKNLSGEPGHRRESAAGPGGDPPEPAQVRIPPPGSISERLKIAYQRRKALVIAGESASEIESEIVELRRELRSGPTLHPGEFLGDGRFELLEEIGQGGFATVWKAYDEHDRQLVAIKVLHGRFAKDVSRRERLFRGARKMASVQHPHVVRVLEPEGEEQGFYYYVMEYVSGGDLHRAVVDGRLDTNGALDVVDSIASALEVTHRSGLVHRDVKPQNILLHGDGRAVLSDFDLVQAHDSTGGTRTGAMGTVFYAAPEQNEDASRVDHRADVYSLGMTAVFCVYGKKLPQDAVFHRDAFVDELPCTDGLRAVLRRAIALRPESRYGSMEDFRADLFAVREGTDTHSYVRGPSGPVLLAGGDSPVPEPVDRPMDRPMEQLVFGSDHGGSASDSIIDTIIHPGARLHSTADAEHDALVGTTLVEPAKRAEEPASVGPSSQCDSMAEQGMPLPPEVLPLAGDTQVVERREIDGGLPVGESAREISQPISVSAGNDPEFSRVRGSYSSPIETSSDRWSGPHSTTPRVSGPWVGLTVLGVVIMIGVGGWLAWERFSPGDDEPGTQLATNALVPREEPTEHVEGSGSDGGTFASSGAAEVVETGTAGDVESALSRSTEMSDADRGTGEVPDEPTPEPESSGAEGAGALESGDGARDERSTKRVKARSGSSKKRRPIAPVDREAKPTGDPEALLAQAREFRNTDPARAYQLAQDAYPGLSRSARDDALSIMGPAACKLKDRKKVEWVLDRLAKADKAYIENQCAADGLKL